MPEQAQTTSVESEKKSKNRAEPALSVDKPMGGPGLLGPDSELFEAAASDGSIDGLAARLGDSRFHVAQRRSLAVHVGQVRGNRHLQRTLAALGRQRRQESEGIHETGYAVQRQEAKAPPHPGAPPPTPFDLTPAMQADISRLATSALQSLTAARASVAYNNYAIGIARAREGILAKKKEEEERQKQQLELLLSAAPYLLPLKAVGGAIGAGISAPSLRGQLLQKVESGLPTVLKAAGTDPKIAAGFTAEVYSKIASESLDKIAEKFNAETATKGVEMAAEKLKAVATKVTLNGSKYDITASYLDALLSSANSSIQALQNNVFTMDDFNALLGIYNVVNSATPELYINQMSIQADHFLSQIAEVLERKGGTSIVYINAYGKRRLAQVMYYQQTGAYGFHAWITPDMEGVYLQIDPNPRELSTDMITGHLPDPVTEPEGQRVVYINAWGKVRLAIVVGAGRSFWTGKPQGYTFVKWVPPDEKDGVIAQGDMQIGGINEVPAGDVKEMQPPQEEK